ncbi:hypothetical protein CV093_14755 [Oceanobacillus sp. 143]|nr:hypothetical protein [Oceanobacillus zhaokaii]QGS69147.1 hypothetical protein CV093_14755 [Oceanobacillus sp. 143]
MIMISAYYLAEIEIIGDRKIWVENLIMIINGVERTVKGLLKEEDKI